MAEELSVDYSYARPSPAAIRAAGYVGVWRYLSTDVAKDLSTAEAAALHAAGLGIGLIWETTADRALAGAAAGLADGIAAAAAAHAVGLPAGAPLLVCVADFAATAAQLDALMAYYHAWRQLTESTWQTGGYATGYVIAGLVARGAQGLWWQNAMDDGGLSGSGISPHAAVYQRERPTLSIAGAAGQYDENIAVGAPAVAWWRAAATAPVTPPVPLWQATALADAKQLAAGVGALVTLLEAHQ